MDRRTIISNQWGVQEKRTPPLKWGLVWSAKTKGRHENRMLKDPSRIYPWKVGDGQKESNENNRTKSSDWR